MSTPHPVYPFLQVSDSDGTVTYAATQEYDFLAFLELMRDRPDVAERVTRVALDADLDSLEKSGAIAFINKVDADTFKTDKTTDTQPSDEDVKPLQLPGAVQSSYPDSDDDIKPPQGLNAGTAPASSRFRWVAQTFAIARGFANDDVQPQTYVNLLANLLSAGLPKLSEVVLPREWEQKFNVEKFRGLGKVTLR